MGTRLKPKNRARRGEGPYRAPRSALIPGAVTRREWLRFLQKVTQGAPCTCNGGPPHSCWLWTGAHNSRDYGHINWRGRLYPAHSFAWIALGGTIPPGFEPDHRCRLHSCVQPQCLEPVSHKENLSRGMCPSAINARKTHCVHGHLLSPENLSRSRLLREGYRRCRVCTNERSRARRLRNRQGRG